MTIRAHFDGTVIVPDEPVDLPVDKPLEVDVRESVADAALAESTDAELQAKLAALQRIVSRARKRIGPSIPDEALRRENMYDDRGR